LQGRITRRQTAVSLHAIDLVVQPVESSVHIGALYLSRLYSSGRGMWRASNKLYACWLHPHVLASCRLHSTLEVFVPGLHLQFNRARPGCYT
jgi:hypothetical protein